MGLVFVANSEMQYMPKIGDLLTVKNIFSFFYLYLENGRGIQGNICDINSVIFIELGDDLEYDPVMVVMIIGEKYFLTGWMDLKYFSEFDA